MGKRIGAIDDLADVHVEADLVAVGDTTAWVEVRGTFNVALTGGGTAQVDCSFDAGATAIPCGALGTVVTLTAPVREEMLNRELGVIHRVRKVSGGGTLHARISQ